MDHMNYMDKLSYSVTITLFDCISYKVSCERIKWKKEAIQIESVKLSVWMILWIKSWIDLFKCVLWKSCQFFYLAIFKWPHFNSNIFFRFKWKRFLKNFYLGSHKSLENHFNCNSIWNFEFLGSFHIKTSHLD